MKKVALLLMVVLCAVGLAACTNSKIDSIEFETKDVTLNIGETFETKILVTPAEETLKEVEYMVANNAVASIENGVITAKACGETIITAKASKKVTADIKVIVNKPTGYSQFASAEYNVIYPSGYLATSKTVSGTEMNMFTSDNMENIIVTAEPKNILYDLLTAETYKQSILAQYAAQGVVATVDVTKFEDTTIGGKKAICIEVSSTVSGRAIKQTQYIVRGDKKDYTVVFTYFTDSFKPIITNVINNFYLK